MLTAMRGMQEIDQVSRSGPDRDREGVVRQHCQYALRFDKVLVSWHAAAAVPPVILQSLLGTAKGSTGNLVVFGTNNGFLEDQKAAGDRCSGI